MWDLKACRICLATDMSLRSLDAKNLCYNYEELTGIKARRGDGLPWCLCAECVALLARFSTLRRRSRRAHDALKLNLSQNLQIHQLDIKALDRTKLNVSSTLAPSRSTNHNYSEFKYDRTSECSEVEYESKGLYEIIMLNLPPDDDKSIQTDNELKTCKLEALDEDGVAIDADDNVFDSDYYADLDDGKNENVWLEVGEVKVEAKVVDGIQEEYMRVIAMTMEEQREVAKRRQRAGKHSKYKCLVCHKGFYQEDRMKHHCRMHDRFVSGPHRCELCLYCYKTERLLRAHQNVRHTYKYACKLCSVVCYERVKAKRHYENVHKTNSTGTDNPLDLLVRRSIKRESPKSTVQENRLDRTKHVRGKCKTGLSKPKSGRVAKSCKAEKLKRRMPPNRRDLPEDFLVLSRLTQQEQADIVRRRSESSNFTQSQYKCTVCYRGFRDSACFENHERRHAVTSGKFECDLCRFRFKTHRAVYRHIVSVHRTKYSCRLCDFVCFARSVAHLHYKFHQNVTYTCQHCGKVSKKQTSHLTHVRLKHPSQHICNVCGNTFVSGKGLLQHRVRVHDINGECPNEPVAEVGLDIYCPECDVRFLSEDAYDKHKMTSANHIEEFRRGLLTNDSPSKMRKDVTAVKERRPITCEQCGQVFETDQHCIRHYKSEHPGVKYIQRYVCEVCGATKALYAALLLHQRVHTNERPFPCRQCHMTFKNGSNRDRHMLTHTGERPYECSECKKRFTQSGSLKLHVRTVHLKLPQPKRVRRKSSAPPLFPHTLMPDM